MMRLRICAYTALLLALATFGAKASASHLKGIMRMNHLQGELVAGAQILSFHAEEDDVKTDDCGRFVMTFSLEPGAAVELQVVAKNLVVVNTIDLQLILPLDPNDHIVNILLCKPEELRHWATKYYLAGMEGAMETTFQKKAETLDREGQPQDAEKLRKRLPEAKALSLSYANALAADPTEAVRGDNGQAWSLFLKGDTAGALALLAPARLERQAQENPKNLREIAAAYGQRGRILALTLDFQGADAAFAKRAELLPRDGDAQFEYAEFLRKQGQPEAAEPYYTQALANAQQRGDSELAAAVLNNFGILLKDQNRPQEALETYARAKEIYTKLATENPSAYEPEYAGTLANIGNLYIAEDKPEAALKPLVKAQGIYEKLGQTGSPAFSRKAASIARQVDSIQAVRPAN